MIVISSFGIEESGRGIYYDTGMGGQEYRKNKFEDVQSKENKFF